MRVVFMGTPDFAVPPLRALCDMGLEVVGVFCQPDKPKGRGRQLLPCPVKQLALEKNIPVFQPVRIRQDGADDLRALAPDLCVTAAFGQILSEDNLAVPTIGTVNVHASLLPRYRGPAPINWAIIHGETVTGVTTMMTDKGMDTGDILLSERFPIGEDMTAGELTAALSERGAVLLRQTVELLMKGTCPRVKQDPALATYDPMLRKETGLMDFNQPARALCCLIRGVDPWPGAYAMLDGEPVKIWKATALEAERGEPGDILAADKKDGLIIRCGDNSALNVTVLQMPGGKRMNAKDYLLGHTISAARFGGK